METGFNCEKMLTYEEVEKIWKESKFGYRRCLDAAKAKSV